MKACIGSTHTFEWGTNTGFRVADSVRFGGANSLCLRPSVAPFKSEPSVLHAQAALPRRMVQVADTFELQLAVGAEIG
jgi:hypothetical protein